MSSLNDVVIVPATATHRDGWLAMRRSLWPECSDAQHASEVVRCLEDPEQVAYLALRDAEMVGFVEVSIRYEYVNGTTTSPVAFVEGIFVKPGHRREGVARALGEGLREWVHKHDVSEVASDAYLDNAASHALHRAMGFEETERVVFFRRTIARA